MSLKTRPEITSRTSVFMLILAALIVLNLGYFMKTHTHIQEHLVAHQAGGQRAAGHTRGPSAAATTCGCAASAAAVVTTARNQELITSAAAGVKLNGSSLTPAADPPSHHPCPL